MLQVNSINSVVNEAFGNNIELLPSVTELFELELAFMEFKQLHKHKLLERSAYIKSFNNQYSRHFLMYSEMPESLSSNRSVITKSYFENGQFSTGYATHGLFPYRGKFHPQLIKGLINIIGIEENDIILDPMAGSGTTNIEAALMGINSIAIDISPFCQLMIETKYNALSINLDLLNKSRLTQKGLFTFFSKSGILGRINEIEDNKKKIYQLAFLAYLDALGYSKRTVKSNHEQLFGKVLTRYIETIKLFLRNPYYEPGKTGKLIILHNSDALQTGLNDNSIDAVITSPPYSFAIDYIENDKDQLEFLGYNSTLLKNRLIGLRGKTKNEKIDNYFRDMDLFCSEVSRVLKKGKHFILIIGSNTNQTKGIRLEKNIIDSSVKYEMPLVKSILKPIKGMRNTMKDEYILIFQKS
jgi:DNA modification methylase